MRLAALIASPLSGPPPRNDRDIELSPRAWTWLRISRALVPLEELGPHRARIRTDLFAPFFGPAPVPLPSVVDHEVPTTDGPLRARIYRPDVDPNAHPGPLPATLYLHGGGFVVGSIDAYDGLCRALCAQSETAVVSLDYRRAPEHPFPAAVDDATACFRWLGEHATALGLDADRMAIAGDSAGGNLAAAACLRLREGAGPAPRFQLLIYPATDFSGPPRAKARFSGCFLTPSMLDWFIDTVFRGPEDRHAPSASVLLADDCRRLPPAHVVTAGFDPFADEAERYAERLAQAEVPASVCCYEDLPHGFAVMAGILPGAARAMDDIAFRLREALRAPALAPTDSADTEEDAAAPLS